mgnify:CR=1 FL=1
MNRKVTAMNNVSKFKYVLDDLNLRLAELQKDAKQNEGMIWVPSIIRIKFFSLKRLCDTAGLGEGARVLDDANKFLGYIEENGNRVDSIGVDLLRRTFDYIRESFYSPDHQGSGLTGIAEEYRSLIAQYNQGSENARPKQRRNLLTELVMGL